MTVFLISCVSDVSRYLGQDVQEWRVSDVSRYLGQDVQEWTK